MKYQINKKNVIKKSKKRDYNETKNLLKNKRISNPRRPTNLIINTNLIKTNIDTKIKTKNRMDLLNDESYASSN